jgi:hypothetical protein
MSAHENLEVFADRPDDLTTDVAGLRAGKPGHDGRTQRRILGIEFVLGALRFRYAASMSGYLARSALGWAHRARGVALVGVEQDVFGAAKFILAAGRAERIIACGAHMRPQPVAAVGVEAGPNSGSVSRHGNLRHS